MKIATREIHVVPRSFSRQPDRRSQKAGCYDLAKVWKLIIAAAVVFSAISPSVSASEASAALITITSQQAGATPFINDLTLTVSNVGVLQSIQFTITPKSGSVTRALSATYPASYLASRGYLN